MTADTTTGPEPRPSNDADEASESEGASSRQGWADRMPTPDEEAAADELDVDPSVAERYQEAAERGANQQGEGRIP